MRDSPSLGSAASPLQHSLCGLNVHAFDHFVTETLSATSKRFNHRPRTFNFSGAGREGPMTWRDLVGMNQALAVETEAPSVLRFMQKGLGIVEAVEDSVKCGNSRSPSSKNDHLQRRRNRVPRRVEREPQVCPKVVCTSNQASACVCDVRSTEDAGSGLDHRQYRPSHRFSDAPNEVSGNCPRNDDELRRRSGRCIQIERMPLGADAVDPDRDRHRPVISDRLDSGPASAGFVFRAYCILQVENDEIAPGAPGLFNRPVVRSGQEQEGPDCEQVDALVAFCFRYSHDRRIMPEKGQTGEDLC